MYMTPIERLANQVGFHSCYTNSFGEQVYATDESRFALLGAMGFKVDTSESIEECINELNNRPWLSLLPDTQILHSEDEQFTISITIKSSQIQAVLSWEILTEGGETFNGSHQLSELTRVAEKNPYDMDYCRCVLTLPHLQEGYHTLQVSLEAGFVSFGKDELVQNDSCHLIVAPKTCYGPKDAADYKMWGLAAQLYSLKSDNSWGLGDFGDLKKLVKDSAKMGASCLGLNPLHPLFPGNPAHRSPYSPTSRNFLNTIYIDVTQTPHFEQCEAAIKKVNSNEFKRQLEKLNSAKMIDYEHCAWLKYQVLELLYQDFQEKHLNKRSKLASQYLKFVKEFGEELETLATFDTLYEHFRKIDFNAYGWTAWPKEFQNPKSQAVKDFQREHADRVGFFQFIQWVADSQLEQVTKAAKKDGMAVGLYLDLAVGCDGGGADVWANREIYVSGGSVGAPPDATNLLGQDWGLTPINPLALKQSGFKAFINALRGNMRHAGALRIDHVLGYMRQYWVAPGKKANEGIYISFPFEEMLRIIALESRRAKCIVIGEDLGTTPEGFGRIMASAGLLSYRVLFFERWENGLFQRPEHYPEQSMVTVSTHDLPTLAGWWTGNDLHWREKLDLYPTIEMGQSDRKNRIADRQQLIDAMVDMKVLDKAKAPPSAPAKMNSELSVAVQEFLAKAPSRIQLIPLEDALGIKQQVNIPGTIDEHPNWLQRLPFDTDEIWHQVDMKNLVVSMHKERGYAVGSS